VKKVMWGALIGAAVALTGAFGASGMSVLKPVADAGTYTGTAGGYPVTFFVAPSRSSVVNISVPLTGLACSPGGAGANDRTFVIAKAAIRNGTFNAKGSQSGVFGGYAARFSYSLSGRFTKATKQHTATAAGSFRDDVRYTDRTGAHLLCTTNKQAWTAARTGPLATPANLVKPGNYTGTAGGFGLSFVAAGSKRSLTTISIPLTGLGCFPAGSGANDRTFTIAQTAVRADGSFSATASQSGVYGGATASFHYFFSGSFQGPNANNVGSAAGVFREDITYTDTAGVQQTCTTNMAAWTATRTS
jgi:hypothetical protein